MYTLLYLKWITHKDPRIAQGTLLNVSWQPGWEGSLGENGYMCIYIIGWVPLLPLETVTTLLIGYTSNKKLKTKKHCRCCCWVAKSICLSFCLPWKTLYSFAFTNRTHCWFASLTSHCFSVSLPGTFFLYQPLRFRISWGAVSEQWLFSFCLHVQGC